MSIFSLVPPPLAVWLPIYCYFDSPTKSGGFIFILVDWKVSFIEGCYGLNMISMVFDCGCSVCHVITWFCDHLYWIYELLLVEFWPLLKLASNFFCCHVQIETRNNKLEMQSVNNKALIEELDKLLKGLHVPTEVCCPSCLPVRDNSLVWNWATCLGLKIFSMAFPWCSMQHVWQEVHLTRHVCFKT